MRSKIIFFVLVLISISACSSQSNHSSMPNEVFDEFWTFVDENYIYFDLKQVDWDEVYLKYSSQITENTSDEDLFYYMESALLELKDGHNRLQNLKQSAKTHNFRENYPIFHSQDLINEKYIKEALGQKGNLSWALLENNIGYLRFPKFNNYSGLKSVFMEMKEKQVEKLIIDVRGNGGGDSNKIPDFLGVLTDDSAYLGAYVEKAGPDHNQVTAPIGVFANHDPDLSFEIPIIVLIDRACYSATSYFAAMIKGFENVTLMGQVTGGGGGGNLGYQLSNGWIVAVSVSDFIDKNNVSIENGVYPDVEIVNSEEGILNGIDSMLEMAMKF